VTCPAAERCRLAGTLNPRRQDPLLLAALDVRRRHSCTARTRRRIFHRQRSVVGFCCSIPGVTRGRVRSPAPSECHPVDLSPDRPCGRPWAALDATAPDHAALRPRVFVRYALREVDGMARCRYPGDLPARRGHEHSVLRAQAARARPGRCRLVPSGLRLPDGQCQPPDPLRKYSASTNLGEAPSPRHGISATRHVGRSWSPTTAELAKPPPGVPCGRPSGGLGEMARSSLRPAAGRGPIGLGSTRPIYRLEIAVSTHESMFVRMCERTSALVRPGGS
jgi:hypothetical protein